MQEFILQKENFKTFRWLAIRSAHSKKSSPLKQIKVQAETKVISISNTQQKIFAQRCTICNNKFTTRLIITIIVQIY